MNVENTYTKSQLSRLLKINRATLDKILLLQKMFQHFIGVEQQEQGSMHFHILKLSTLSLAMMVYRMGLGQH